MRFHGLMLLRDEEDIIRENLTHLLTWIDALYIYDLGSTDRTWDIVQDFAAKNAKVIPYRREPTVYADGLRCVLFDRYRTAFRTGDWVMKLDADEFYPVSPPTFVRERLRPDETIVHLQWYFFRLTMAEVLAYQSGAVSVVDDRYRSIRERRRFFKISHYSEPRMFRYRSTMRWPHTVHWPFNTGLTARARLPVLHYPHRDPDQMHRRFRLRAAMMRLAAEAGGHWRSSDWQDDVVDQVTGISNAAESLRKEGLSGDYGIDTGPLYFWKPGTELPEIYLDHHLPFGPRRLAQKLIHALFLPFLDRQRPPFDPGYRPHLISEEANGRIGADCVAQEHGI